MEAADRVDSTTGVQMAYLKQWATRSNKDLELRVPDVLPRAANGKGRVTQLDALEAAKRLSADAAYLDPPYNQHKYLGNYHIWETLVRWDAPEAYGVARKRVDVRARKSPYNSKRGIHAAMSALIDAVDANALVVSYSNEGYIQHDDMVQILSARARVFVRKLATRATWVLKSACTTQKVSGWARPHICETRNTSCCVDAHEYRV